MPQWDNASLGASAQDGFEILFYDLAAEIGKIKGPNDGVVNRGVRATRRSQASRCWKVNHTAEIGRSKAILNVLHPGLEAFKEHMARYNAGNKLGFGRDREVQVRRCKEAISHFWF